MSKTGRFYVKGESGKVYCVEPIDDTPVRKRWGDIDPASKKVTGEYGMDEENRSSIRSDESIITEENGYKDIYWLEPGTSPIDFINQLEKQNIKNNI